VNELTGIYSKPKRTRENRIEILLKMMKERGEQSEEITLAKFCIDEVVSEEKAREYLRLLRLSGKLDETPKI
jgi:hypothetical protein